MSSHTFCSSYLCVLAIFTLLHCSLCDENSNTGNVGCIGYERDVLLEFKNDLIDGANRLVSWNSTNKDCCKWYGITCNNQTGHVSEIRLRGPDDMYGQEASIQKFGGKLNPSLRNLTSLEYLDLSSNDFGGNLIPSYIGSLQNLTYLNLSDSGFSGEIPSQLGNLSELRVLSVRNLFSNDEYALMVKSLQWLSGLSLLRHLDMSGVPLGAVFNWPQVTRTLLPSSLVELRLSSCGLPPITPGLTSFNFNFLSILDLSSNNLNGVVPAGLMNMISLVTLDLSDNKLTGIQNSSSIENICNFREINFSWNVFGGKSLLELLTSLFECNSSKLESLQFASSGLSGNLPPQLGNLKSLVHINLYNNSISGLIPTSLGSLSSLQTLDLGANSIFGPIPDSIGRLSSLRFMHLGSNSISGPLPDSLGRLSSLEELDLSNNEINGTIPQSIGQLTKLMNLNIEHNLLTGVVTEDHFANLTSLATLLAEGNVLLLEISDNNWEPPFQLERLSLNSWILGPKFPSWLQNQTNLSILYLARTGISDNIPSWFWKTLSGIQYLNLAHNDFSSLSMNNFFCSKTNAERKQVIYMNMWNTSLSGVLPDCWETWEFLNMLNFMDNNLTGEIPRSLANLSSLGSLNMGNNKFSGEVPLNLLNSNSLQIIDLSENELTGGIPISTGGEVTSLRTLSLSSNKLNGKIPDEICRLESIQILDLADNNLSGKIPNCFNNFSVMTGKVNPDSIVTLAGDEFMGSAWLLMKGKVNGYSSILGLVTFLDLSGNNLSGTIPSEISQLVELRFLNISSNQLTGRIPEKIGDMKVLQSLDMSMNRLDGSIPLSMSRLSFLNSLNMSYNNLTGRIPSSTQLQSLQESSFVGNKLCGAPVRLGCQRQGSEGMGDAAGEGEGSGGSGGPDWELIISIVVGFIVGFWVVVAPLISSKSWRSKYFQFLNDIWFKFCDCMPRYSSNKRRGHR